MYVREGGTKDWFYRWGDTMFKYRKLVIMVWVVLFIVLSIFAQKAPGLLKDNGFTPKGSESDIGLHRLQEKFKVAPSTFTLVYETDTLNFNDTSVTNAIISSLEPLRQLSFVADIIPVTPALLAGQSRMIQPYRVNLTLTVDEALDQYPDIRKKITPPAGTNVYLTGGTPILYDMQNATKNDIVKAEMIGLPIALIVLLLIFGTWIGALLPMVVGVTSVSVTLGVVYFIALKLPLSNFLPNMVTMLGLAVGIDYALFIVSRFREELVKNPDVRQAVARTCQMAGKSIFFSGIAVLIGMFGMLFIDLSIYRALCIGGVLVVAISVLVANTLLLALLGLFGHKINRYRVLPARLQRNHPSRFWEQVAYTVMKRPLPLVLIMSGLLIVMMQPIGDMKLGMPNAEVLPPSYESRYGSDLLEQAYDERETNPIQIYLETKADFASMEAIQEVAAYTDRIQQIDGIKQVHSYISSLQASTLEAAAVQLQNPLVKQQMVTQRLAAEQSVLLVVIPEESPDSDLTAHAVKSLRLIDKGNLQEVFVTGGPAYQLDIIERVKQGIPFVVIFVMVVTYLVLLVAFRSVLIPLKAVAMNVLSLGASFGIVVTVFQKGFMAEWLQITSTGYVSATLPVIIFCVVFGISMDYEVFLLSRIKEEYVRTGDNERSTAVGLAKTGSLITSAAFILIVVVGTFIFTDIEIIKALGLGLTLAVLIDATLIRMVIVPALMKLLGKANWWAPRWLMRDE